MTTLVDDFRAGLARGELLIQACNACGKAMMYPRYRCIFCHSDDLGWRKSTGKGTLHSYTVVRAIPPAGFEDETPYALGVVKLEEGVQLLARLAPLNDGEWSGYACDKPVAFEPSPSRPRADSVAWFKLAA